MKYSPVKWLLLPLLVCAVVATALIPRTAVRAASAVGFCTMDIATVNALGWFPGTNVTVSVNDTVVAILPTDASGNVVVDLNTTDANNVIVTGFVDGVTPGSVAVGSIECPDGRIALNDDSGIGSRVGFHDGEVMAVYCRPVGYTYTYVEIWQTVPQVKFIYGAELNQFRAMFRPGTAPATEPWAAAKVVLSRAATQGEAIFGFSSFGVVASLAQDGNSVLLQSQAGTKTFSLMGCAATAGRFYLPTPVAAFVPPAAPAPAASTTEGVAGGGTSTGGAVTTGGGFVGGGTGAISMPPSNNATLGYYTVRPGDTLFTIAQRHGTSVSALVQANPQYANNTRLVYAGAQLAIPGGTSVGVTAQAARPAGTLYVVQAGDWIYQIARNFNTTPQAIIAANPQIGNGSRITPGQQLIIP